MKQVIRSVFELMGFEIRRIRRVNQSPVEQTVKQYFNTGELTPLQENSLELYEAFYGDDLALEEYYFLRGDRLPFYDAVIAFLLDKKIDLNGKNVIDVGCGVGYLLFNIQQKFRTAKLAGSDFSPKAIEFSKAKFPAIDFYCHNLDDPIPGNYDVIICTEVLEHLEKPHLAIANMMNAVLKGGLLILTVPNGRSDYLIEHINFWSPESWRFFLERECSNGEIQTATIFNNSKNIAIIKKK